MPTNERERMRVLVQNWERTGTLLKKLRVEEYGRSDITETILSLSDASEAALTSHPPKPISGLVEMQRLFLKMKKK